ncbi:MAG: DegV family protein [Bacilli bacterium]|nr:DegV family protein [Bacilli bacterium]
MKIALSAETTIDLTPALLQEYDIHIVPFSVILGDQAKLDGEMSNQDIFDYVAKNNKLPKTSAVNQFQYEEHFKKLLENYDAVIHLSLSSEISSAYRNALLAAEEFNGKVHIIDSRSLSTGIALLAFYAHDLITQGLDDNVVVEKVKARIPSIQISFVIKQLDYLYKGGRCSKLAMFGANIFHICPQIIMSDGKMAPGKKYRGLYQKVVADYIDDTLAQFNHPDLERASITYSSLDDEKEIVEMVKAKLTARGFKRIYQTYAGGTITCHCGPNTIGIAYFNDHE